MSALHAAARDGDLKRLAAALDAGDAPDAVDEAGQTALFVAAVGGHAAAVDLLLSRGADPEAPLGEDPALVAAASRRLAAVVARLLQDDRTDPNRRDGRGWGALTAAAFAGQASIVEVLLARPDLRASARDAQGRNALWWAATAGRSEAALLLAGRPELHLVDDDGVGPADAAAAAGHDRLAHALSALAPTPLPDPDESDRYVLPDVPLPSPRSIRDQDARLRGGE